MSNTVILYKWKNIREPYKRCRSSCIQEKFVEHLQSTTHSATEIKNKAYLERLYNLGVKGLNSAIITVKMKRVCVYCILRSFRIVF